MKFLKYLISKFRITSTTIILSSISINVSADTNFQKWISNFYQTASQNGIKRSTYDKAFRNITIPDTDVLRKARHQPEFTNKIWDYLDARVNPLSISNGQHMAQQHAKTLIEIEKQYGIDQSILLAIWSIESNYGAALKRIDRLHYVPHALATLAYADKRRKKFARSQLIATLQILQSNEISTDQLMGSWAGAMGHTQFIPTSYQMYAIDMNQDGVRDIWNSIPDALATAANLLKKNGWRTGESWGYEVKLPNNGLQHAGKTKTLSEWKELGLLRANNQSFPYPKRKAKLKLMADTDKPAFLMMRNFYIIKRYNNSDAYALSVALLADRLSGRNGLVQSWPRPPGALTGLEKFELQTHLKEKGYYTGEIDGNLGTASRKAIRNFQKDQSLPIDGNPSKQLLKHLKQ